MSKHDGATYGGYEQAHYQVKSQRGRAVNYLCVDCGEPASQWSLVDEKRCIGNLCVSGKFSTGLPQWFSDCVADYEPRCSPCHRAEDAHRREVEFRAVERWLDPQPYENDLFEEVFA